MSDIVEQTSGMSVRPQAERRSGPDFSGIPLASPRGASAFSAPRSGPFIIQPKLVVGHVNDPLEAEADRTADRVMRMPTPAPPQVSRKCGCEKDVLRPKQAGPAIGGGAAPTLVHDVLRRPGRRLDAATRAFFEPRFGCDLSHVRVSTDNAAAESAVAVGARAYTVGGHIVFGRGQFAPATHEGRRLIAHELTHVVQQGGARQFVIRRSPDKYSGLGIEELRALVTKGDQDAVWALKAQYDAMPPGVVAQYARKDPIAQWSYESRVISPKEAAGQGAFSKPGMQDTLAADIKATRQATGIPRRAPSAVEPDIRLSGGTSGVARTDIPGLENRPFIGRSSLAGGPGPNPQSSFSPATDVTQLPHTHGHAEQNIADQLEEALAKIPREQLKGRRVWMLIEQAPCPTCAAGALKAHTAAGVLKKLSLKYPELTIEVKNLESSALIVLKGSETTGASGAAGVTTASSVGEQAASVEVETSIEVTKSVRNADGTTVSELEYNFGKSIEEINKTAPQGAKVPERLVIRITQNADGSVAAAESLSGQPNALAEALAEKTLGLGGQSAAAAEGAATGATATISRRTALLFKGLKIGGTAAFVVITGYQLFTAAPKDRPRVLAGAAGGLAGGALGTYLACNALLGIESAGWSLLICAIGAGGVGGYAGSKAGEAIYDEATATDLDRAYLVLGRKKPNEIGIFNVLIGRMGSDGCIDAEFVRGFMSAFPESASDTETVLIAAQLADAPIDHVPPINTLRPKRPSPSFDRDVVCPACHGRSMKELVPQTMTADEMEALRKLPTCPSVLAQALGALRNAVRNLPPRKPAPYPMAPSIKAPTSKQLPPGPRSFPPEREQIGAVCPNCHAPNRGRQIWKDFGPGPDGQPNGADMERLMEIANAWLNKP
ncbi:DUF4157 domain-containing protein [Mycolicibacterium rufum]|uniref:DUF4157 domain-containing protein n=1 Tax=Mycolicibacterium rufum TaxID=318424 RepID=A0A9X2XUP5_9MYCO|nr:DUF4157 domain-containing protein [Mycolicibacterium rufum]MCV7070126.1 DUF4157 domain-containing protein [Mycolicibacterium rufum]ULP38003.1 DUF4157 domain-containing protein [Mycolicibacterium rufum]